MVYNAMKLFMEINPQLFDDCSHEYTELQNSAENREQTRQKKWEKLATQAKQMGAGKPVPSKHTAATPKFDLDPVTQDSQKRLDALKLDEAHAAKESEKPSSVSRTSSYSSPFLRRSVVLSG